MEQYITRIVDPWDINDINDFLNSSRHRFSYDSARYPIEYSKVFLNGLVDDLQDFLQLYEIKDKTSLVIRITSSLERASEYIELNGKQVIILDIHQIYECVDAIILTCLAELGSSALVDWNMEKIEELVARQDDIARLCDEYGIDKETFYEFLNQHEIDNDVIAPNYLHNLADIYYTMGYVDASMVCLNIIKNIPLFCCLTLVLDYSNFPAELGELMLFRTMDFDDDRKTRLIKELSDALDLLHEVYYIPAIVNTINSFQTNIVHKEMNTLCFGENKKKIVLDETYWNSQQINQNTRVGNIDFIVYQKQIMHLYLEYKAYCFKNRE